ncbi:MAG: spore maturation protein A, partial [Clostridia bacterium]|nr:spore maturation protein A [Clostridia bacterium]
MLLQYLWLLMIATSLLWGMLTGQGNLVLPAALEGAQTAITVSLQLLAGYLFFCGMIEIMNKLEIRQKVSLFARPLIQKLMGATMDDQAVQAVCMNLSANLLGLGNAATPYGIEAARLIDGAESRNRHGLYMLLIINATSIQLLPTTVLTLRIAAGSVQPNAILVPSMVSTAVST